MIRQASASTFHRSVVRKDMNLSGFDRITIDPAVMGGKPCIRGMRVTVGMIMGMLAAERTFAEILHLYHYLEEADIRAALSFAAWRVQEREIPLTAA